MVLMRERWVLKKTEHNSTLVQMEEEVKTISSI